MTRVTKPADNNQILIRNVVGPLIDDYVSISENDIVRVGPTGHNCNYITDGTADNVQIDLALIEIAGGGAVEFMPNTTYNMAAGIQRTLDNITLKFNQKSKLRLNNGVNQPVLSFTGQNIRIENPVIDGNLANQTDVTGEVDGLGNSQGLDLAGIDFQPGSENCKIINPEIYNCGMSGINFSGIASSPQKRMGVLGGSVHDCGWNGVTFNSDVKAGNIHGYCKGVEIYNCSDVGVSTYGIDTTIEDNYIHDCYGVLGSNNASWGIGLEGDNDSVIVKDNRIEGCTIGINSLGTNGSILENYIYGCIGDAYVSFGILIYGAKTTTLNKNYIWGGNSFGIGLIQAATDNSLLNNYIWDNGNAGGGGQVGLSIDGNSLRNRASGNRIFDTRSSTARKQLYGLLIYSGSNNNIVTGENYLMNHPTADYADYATGTIYHNNIVNGVWVA